jgi:hypothetical protein
MNQRFTRIVAAAVVCAAVTGVSKAQSAETGANVVLWDTGTSLGDTIDLRNRAGWKAVPVNLFMLEADPARASSDPGYYGREYEFQGDAIVETGRLTAVFWSGQGKVVFYSKTGPGRKVVEFTPQQTTGKPARISRCSVLQNTGDDAALEVSFAAEGIKGEFSALLALGRTEIVEIKPAASMKGIRLLSSIAYGIVPDFIGDDLIFRAGQYPSVDTLHVPAEGLFLGLLPGEDSMLVLTWPKGKQQMRLGLSKEGQEGRLIESIDFDNDGQSIYLALLEARGVWHRETLTGSYLEKDVTSSWKRPFHAKWITQLQEGSVRTTYALREAPGQIWRGVAGMYSYPVWFKGDNAAYHLGKKVLPKGESLIYCLEPRNTPASIATPVDILKATLGRPACDSILDLPGQKLRTHHRRGAEGVRRACTCGCTEAIQAVFDAGQEVERKEYVAGAVGDMLYFVSRHMERLNEYRTFADDMTKLLRTARTSAPELKMFLDNLEPLARRIPQEYNVQKENIKSLVYANELARKTNALTARKDAGNLAAYKDLSEAWRAMGGAQDGLLAEYHILVRQLAQETGYGCVNLSKAVELAQEIRRRCRQCLRNPDGYEIWPDY